MKKIISFFIVLIFLCSSLTGYASGKTILLEDIKVEIITKVVNINRIPLLIRGLTKYMEDNDLLKNYYKKIKTKDIVKQNILKVRILRYEANKYILFRVQFGKSNSEGSLIKVKLGKFAEYRKISESERKSRERVKKYYIREELSEAEADAYTFYTVLIGLGVDKALRN